jgi:hypothetical protein
VVQAVPVSRLPAAAAAARGGQPPPPENDCVPDDTGPGIGGAGGGPGGGGGGIAIGIGQGLAGDAAAALRDDTSPRTLVAQLPGDNRLWKRVPRVAVGVGVALARAVEDASGKGAYAAVNLQERAAFQNGRKRIAVLSAASGSGISLHDMGGVSRRRAHLLPQPPWTADQLVQQVGRSHRSGQRTAPEYTLVVSGTNGQCVERGRWGRVLRPQFAANSLLSPTAASRPISAAPL